MPPTPSACATSIPSVTPHATPSPPPPPPPSPTRNTFAIDTKDPEPISATFDKTHLAAGETATVTVTFNEIVNNVTEDTFQIPNGSVSNLRQDTTDGRIWKATFTPTANLQSASSSISI